MGISLGNNEGCRVGGVHGDDVGVELVGSDVGNDDRGAFDGVSVGDVVVGNDVGAIDGVDVGWDSVGRAEGEAVGVEMDG